MGFESGAPEHVADYLAKSPLRGRSGRVMLVWRGPDSVDPSGCGEPPMQPHSSHQIAVAALVRSGPTPPELLVVDCAAEGHRLAEVVDTDRGPVVLCHTEAPQRWAELLDDPFVGDGLRAWCECGAHLLSRRWVLAQVHGARHVVPV